MVPMSKLDQTTWILTLASLNNVVETDGGYFTLDKDKLDGPALLAPEVVV